MAQYSNCPNCFSPLPNGAQECPKCGKNIADIKLYPNSLPPFTVLNNRYVIGRVLGKGGFGITYIAKDMKTNALRAVKEYMPAEYSSRPTGSKSIAPHEDDKARYVFNHGKEKFIDEARTLSTLIDNPNVVTIVDFFSENNTAYLVMEYLDGQNLREMARANGGRIDPELAKRIFVIAASALIPIHGRNILHRDLSPENIIVTNDGNIKLIDFGAARDFVSAQNNGLSVLLKIGFAPPEQYSRSGKQGPYTDVYALCATFYTLVSGRKLVDALFIARGEKQPTLFELGCPVTKKTSDVIARGMHIDYTQRYQSFMQLLNDIDISLAPQVQAPPPPQVRPVPPKPVGPQPQPSVISTKQTAVPPQGMVPSMQRPMPQAPNPPVANGGANVVTPPPQPPRPAFSLAAVIGSSISGKMPVNTTDIFKIGRSPQACQFVVAGDMNISRTHCYIKIAGKNAYLVDTSVNGTFFENGRRLEKNKEYPITPKTKFYLSTKNHMLIFDVM